MSDTNRSVILDQNLKIKIPAVDCRLIHDVSDDDRPYDYYKIKKIPDTYLEYYFKNDEGGARLVLLDNSKSNDSYIDVMTEFMANGIILDEEEMAKFINRFGFFAELENPNYNKIEIGELFPILQSFRILVMLTAELRSTKNIPRILFLLSLLLSRPEKCVPNAKNLSQNDLNNLDELNNFKISNFIVFQVPRFSLYLKSAYNYPYVIPTENLECDDVIMDSGLTDDKIAYIIETSNKIVENVINYNIERISYKLNMEEKSLNLVIPDLITAMYYSVSMDISNGIIYRKCRKHDCNNYFKVVTTNSRKNFCCKKCERSYQGFKYRNKKKTEMDGMSNKEECP